MPIGAGGIIRGAPVEKALTISVPIAGAGAAPGGGVKALVNSVSFGCGACGTLARGGSGIRVTFGVVTTGTGTYCTSPAASTEAAPSGSGLSLFAFASTDGVGRGGGGIGIGLLSTAADG